jgi:hypothetical protein
METYSEALLRVAFSCLTDVSSVRCAEVLLQFLSLLDINVMSSESSINCAGMLI